MVKEEDASALHTQAKERPRTSGLRSWDSRLKTILAIVWFLFTFSMVAWWWIYALNKAALSPSDHRMFAWEGSILLTAVIAGGITMIYLTFRDEERHGRLRFFFSTFSHDIKTSIARLRLQAEVLDEEWGQLDNPVFKRLIQDISRLDLQLENSLLLSNLEENPLFVEALALNDLLQHLRIEFSDLQIEISSPAIIQADRRAVLSVLKNLFQNASLHGKASRIDLKLQESGGELIIAVQDNGIGFQGDRARLGSEILRSKDDQGNGIGLLLSKRLVGKMKGRLSFSNESARGFCAVLRLPGRLS